MSVQDSCMVGARRTIGLEIVLDTPLMLPLGDEALVEARLGSFEHSANLDARLVHGMRRRSHRLRNHNGRIRCNSLGTCIMRNLTSFHLKTVLVSVQVMCMVCARCTIGLLIILHASDGTTR